MEYPIKHKFTLVYLLILSACYSYSQHTLKLKPYLGYFIGYSSYFKDGKPISNGVYDFRKLSTIKSFPRISMGLLLEYNLNSHSYLQIGFIGNEDISLSAEVNTFLDDTISNPGFHTNARWMTKNYSGVSARKYPLWYCFDIYRKKNKDSEYYAAEKNIPNRYNSLTLLCGLSLVKAGFFYDDPTGLQGSSTSGIISLPSGDTIVSVHYKDYRAINRKYYTSKNRYGVSVNLGLNYHVHNRKGKELVQLSLYYEKGTKVYVHQNISIQKKNYIYYEGIRSRGTALHFNVLIPITLKKFLAK